MILLKDSGRLGREGDVVEVKDGYARNFLIPQGLAFSANDKNFNRLQEMKKTKVKVAQKERQKNLELKDAIEKISVTIAVEAKDDETLYGTINEAQILKQLKTEGVDLLKGQIVLEETIAKLGVYNLKINLHEGVEGTLRLWVMKK